MICRRQLNSRGGTYKWPEKAAFWTPRAFEQFLEIVSIGGRSRGVSSVKAKPVRLRAPAVKEKRSNGRRLRR